MASHESVEIDRAPLPTHHFPLDPPQADIKIIGAMRCLFLILCAVASPSCALNETAKLRIHLS